MNKFLTRKNFRFLLVLVFLLFLNSNDSFSQTIIPAGYTIADECNYNPNSNAHIYTRGSETWSPANNPYIIEGRV